MWANNWFSSFLLALSVIFFTAGCMTLLTQSSQESGGGYTPSKNDTGAEGPVTDREKGSRSEVGAISTGARGAKAKTEAPSVPTFTEPEVVRGIYVTAPSAGGRKFPELVELVAKSKLNAMVIDIKDDDGHITYPLADNELTPFVKPYIKNPEQLMQTLSENDIYPIARIVVFKDTVLAKKKPEWSFSQGENVWRSANGEAFVNPYLREVWEHNVAVAKQAAALGFKEIQFDYVRFPEGFETFGDSLTFERGTYASVQDPLKARVKAVTDFVAYAKKELAPYAIDVSVDIFGYAATVPAASGIGQDFSAISAHVDVISSMIYPSHWGFGNFGLAKPDLEPYALVMQYVVREKEKLLLVKNPPRSRPWLQDFTATYLGAGNYIPYGKTEVEAQIRALNEAGIKEFLLWNAANDYTPDVNYTPALDEARQQAIRREDRERLDENKGKRKAD